MDDERFDDLARRLRVASTRRSALAALLTLPFGAAAGAAGKKRKDGRDGKSRGKGRRPAVAQPGCRREGHPCQGNQVCCPGLECRVTGPGAARRCARPPVTCAAFQETCGGNTGCCAGVDYGDANPCKNGRCCDRTAGYTCLANEAPGSPPGAAFFCNVFCDELDPTQQTLHRDDTLCASARPCPNGISDCGPGYYCGVIDCPGCPAEPICVTACQTRMCTPIRDACNPDDALCCEQSVCAVGDDCHAGPGTFCCRSQTP